MAEKKKYCEDLYNEYLELAKKTHIRVENYVPGKPLTPQHINPEDLLKKEEVRLKLLECRDILPLKEHEWFEIENG